MAVFAVMVYRVSIILVMYKWTQGTAIYSKARLLISASAAFLNLVAIVILNQLYYHVALWLTNMEKPRTQTDFEDSYTFKVFMFQFINYYASLAYIAFFKGKFFSHPGDLEAREGLGRFKNDVCDPSGCLYELCIQLAIIMVGKQTMNNFMEIFFPKMRSIWNRWVYRKNKNDVDVEQEDGAHKKPVHTRWEQDYSLTRFDRLGLLDEYLEMGKASTPLFS